MERRIPTQKPISEPITISVAEYHCLTKAATMLELILNAEYDAQRSAVVSAAKATVNDMQRMAEEGAAE